METKTYNPGKALLTLLIAGVFSLNSSAATKGHQNVAPTNGTEKWTETVSTSKTEQLSGLMQEWMENGSYWESSKTSSENNRLMEEMEDWMSNGKYWSETKEDQKSLNRLTDTLKNWMNKGLYWNSEK